MKKFIVLILCLLLYGCNTATNNENINLFDIEKASYTANEYMNALSEGEIGLADTLCKDIVISDREADKLENNKIKAFKVLEKSEGADYAYIKYLVIRGDNNEIRADLDSIELKVSKLDDVYKITSVDAKNVKQVYLDKENIRIIDGETGKSDLLLRKRDIPKEVFSKGNEITLTMDKVLDVQFSKLNVGFQGKTVGITLGNGDKTLVILSVINDVKDNNSNSVPGGALVMTNQDIEEELEKPISEKIVGYDLVDSDNTEKILFTDNDEALVIQFKNKNQGSMVRIYKNPTGKLMDLDMDKRFPQDKYSLDVQKITEGGIFINVTPISSDAEESGLYIVDIKNMDVSKDE